MLSVTAIVAIGDTARDSVTAIGGDHSRRGSKRQ